MYITAVREEGRLPAIQRFSDAIAAHAGLSPGTLRLTDWHEVLSSALDVTVRSKTPLLVIDELPYLLQHSSEIPGVLQQLYDERQRGTGAGPGPRVILCGSAVSVMHELLSGTKPLRGRAVVDLRLGAFDYRAARKFWQIDDPLTALQVHAVPGGAPGYRPVTARPHPNDGFAAWLSRTLLNPGRAVYSRTETEYLLREDPRITHYTLYYDILTAIAQGATTPTKIGAALERRRNAVTHPLDVLESTGYIRREQDILRPRHPVIRFNQLITLPQAATVEQGFAEQAWQAAAPPSTPRSSARTSRSSPVPSPAATPTPCSPAVCPARSVPPRSPTRRPAPSTRSTSSPSPRVSVRRRRALGSP